MSLFHPSKQCRLRKITFPCTDGYCTKCYAIKFNPILFLPILSLLSHPHLRECRPSNTKDTIACPRPSHLRCPIHLSVLGQCKLPELFLNCYACRMSKTSSVVFHRSGSSVLVLVFFSQVPIFNLLT